jgi:hypothetical protein
MKVDTSTVEGSSPADVAVMVAVPSRALVLRTAITDSCPEGIVTTSLTRLTTSDFDVESWTATFDMAMAGPLSESSRLTSRTS